MSSSESDRDQSPRRLVRTRRGRLIGGVCSGLGAHFGVDPILFRIAFVGLAIFSGVGIGLYLAILLLVPEEGASRAPIRLRRSSWRSILGVVAIIAAAGIALHAVGHGALDAAWGFGAGLGSIALVGAVATLVWLRLRGRGGEQGRPSADRRLLRCLALVTAVTAAVILSAAAGAWLAGTDGRLAAWAVVAIGVALTLAAITGTGARTARRLVLLALAFALSVAVTTAAGVDLHGGLGERTYRPAMLSQVRDGYRLGAGRLEIDLRDVRFPAGNTPLRVQLGMGEVVVLVPDDVCVATHAQIGGGYIGALDRESGGLDVNWVNLPSPPPPPPPLLRTPRLVLNARVGLGALFVADRPFDHAWNGGWGSSGGSGFQPGVYGANESCYRTAGASR
jgi:phage shock protein PspC (stress-responsive transcriptional regulator)